MSAIFIYTPRGYYNLSHIKVAAFNKDGTHRLCDLEGMEIDGSSRSFGEQIVSVLPCSEPLELLSFMPGDDDHPEDEILIEPVVAWGLTALGHLRPITPAALEGVTESGYGLRKVGQDRVYTMDNVGGWKNADDWRSSKKKSAAS